MKGWIIVLWLVSAGANAQLNAGHGGAWFDPQTPGQGLLVEVLGDDEIFIAWFTYETAAQAKVGAAGQRWLTGQGEIDGNEVALTLYQTSGGLFDAPTMPSTIAVGSATLRFPDCLSGTFEYALDEGLSGSIELVRISSGSYCQALSDQ